MNESYRVLVHFAPFDYDNQNDDDDVSVQLLRRTACFNAHLRPSTLVALRVLRDLCRRSPTWRRVFVTNDDDDDWLLELVLCRCCCCGVDERDEPVLAVRRVLEMLSAGLLLFDDDVDDDCIEFSSLFAHVGRQERDELTHSAQHALHLLATNRIGDLLAINLFNNG